MSHRHLQRIVVRMLYDPVFAAQVFADPGAALEGEDLTEQERSWLVGVDRRAYAVDPLRRTRMLAVLCEEFPVSVHHLVQHTQAPACLEDFFTSTAFHACIQQRGSLAAAFGAYLSSAPLRERYPHLALAPLVQIEAAIAQLRRQYDAPIPAVSTDQSLLTLTATARLLASPVGLLTHYHLALEVLSRDTDGLVAAACKPSALSLPPYNAAHEWLLIVWHQHSESAVVEVLPDALGQLLAGVPAQRATLVSTACKLGATLHEAEEIIADLLADGVLQ